MLNFVTAGLRDDHHLLVRYYTCSYKTAPTAVFSSSRVGHVVLCQSVWREAVFKSGSSWPSRSSSVSVSVGRDGKRGHNVSGFFARGMQ